MVLQQNAEAPFWGKAKPDTKVSIQASWGESANTTADANGLWFTKLKTPAAGGPFEIKINAGETTVPIKNVLSGEVWLG